MTDNELPDPKLDPKLLAAAVFAGMQGYEPCKDIVLAMAKQLKDLVEMYSPRLTEADLHALPVPLCGKMASGEDCDGLGFPCAGCWRCLAGRNCYEYPTNLETSRNFLRCVLRLVKNSR
mgnify:CR=1 FL=1